MTRLDSIPIVETPLSAEDLRRRYPRRALPAASHVTRFAPSPTGFLHIGGLYTALVSRHLARQSDGVFILRLEDTDKRREIAGAAAQIPRWLKYFGLEWDEGVDELGREKGNYGPYKQSERREIYAAFARQLLESNQAYLCFASEEELAAIAEKQKKASVNPGYYGPWAIWRERTAEDVERALDQGLKPVVRFRAPALDDRAGFDDELRGSLPLRPNELDVVLLKSDGLPTYHFAHVVDDYLMGTTHVVRSDEWLPSLPLHNQLFEALALPKPKFVHVSPIQKLDDNKRRKLSKRLDPEADVAYFAQHGYPAGGIAEYLLNLADPAFEDWRRANPDKDALEFRLTIASFSKSGALFDEAKLTSVSQDAVARMEVTDAIALCKQWASAYDEQSSQWFERGEDRLRAVLEFNRGGKRPRKDIAKWSDLKRLYPYVWQSPEPAETRDAFTALAKNAESLKAIAEALLALEKLAQAAASGDELLERLREMPKVALAPANPGEKAEAIPAPRMLRLALSARVDGLDLPIFARLLGIDEIRQRVSRSARATNG